MLGFQHGRSKVRDSRATGDHHHGQTPCGFRQSEGGEGRGALVDHDVEARPMITRELVDA